MSGNPWGAAFGGLAQGLQTGFSMGTAIEQRKLVEKREKLQEFETVAKAMEYARTNPAQGEQLLKDIWTNMGVPKERQDADWKTLKSASDTEYMGIKKAWMELGMKGDVPGREWLKMTPSVRAETMMKMRTLQGEMDASSALREASGEAAPTVGAPQVQEAGGPPATPPVAAAPAGVSPPQTASPAATATAAPSLSETRSSVQGVTIKTPDGKDISPTPQKITPLAEKSISDAQRYLKAADILEKRGGPGASEKALEFRDKARKMADSAWLQMANPQKQGYKPGSVVMYNAITGDQKVTQAGENTFAILGSDKKKQLGFEEGDVVQVSSNGQLSVVRAGKELMKDLTPDEKKKLNLPEDAIAQRNSATGAINILDKGTEKFTTLTPEEVEEAGLKPGTVAQKSQKTGKTDVVQAGSDRFTDLTPEQMKKAGFKAGAIVQRNATTGEILVKQQGEERFRLLSEEEAIAEGFNIGDIVERSSSGKTTRVAERRDEFVPVTDTMKERLRKQGFSLGDGAYEYNRKTGKIGKVEDPEEEWEVVSEAQRKELGLPLSGQPMQRRVTGKGKGRVEVIGTRTEADPLEKALSGKDVEELTNVRTAGRAATEVRRSVETIRAAQQGFRTGRIANWRLWAQQLMSEVMPGKEYIPGTKQGELLETEFSKNTLGRAGQLAGSIQVKELTFLQDAGPSLLKTPEGNELIVAVMDEGAKRQEEVSALAEKWVKSGKKLSDGLEEYGGKNFYEVQKDITSAPLPRELMARITDVKNDAPDPKIKSWDMPISQMNEQQAVAMSNDPEFLRKATDGQKRALRAKLQGFVK